MNREYPGRISEAKIEQALRALDGGLKDEWDHVRANNERMIEPVLGAQYVVVAPHLAAASSLTPDDYRKKWGLPPDYPMVAPNYSTAR